MRNFFNEITRVLDQFLTPAVKTIFLINVAVCLGLNVLLAIAPAQTGMLIALLAQYPGYSVGRFFVWQFFTYMFVHVQVFHLLMNMLALWFFAPALESRWGPLTFWKFYLIVGVGAGLLHALLAVTLVHNEMSPIIGASGAIYGVLLAYAAYYPEQTVLLWFIVPIKIKYLMGIMIFLVFMGTAGGNEGNISNLTHLTGLGVAYAWLALRHKTWDIRRWQWTRT